jgi:proline iminopeptidase
MPRLTDCVAGLVLALVTTTSGREVRWITEDVGRIFPREWDRFAAAIPDSFRWMRLVDAYATLLADPDPAVRSVPPASGAFGRTRTYRWDRAISPTRALRP